MVETPEDDRVVQDLEKKKEQHSLQHRGGLI